MVAVFNRNAKVAVCYVPEPRLGLHHARHAGARLAEGDILVFTDDDCVAHPHWLAELLRAYTELDADAAGGKILIRWDKEPPPWVVAYEEVLGKLDYGSQALVLKAGQYINGGNFSIRRSRLFEIGGFNPDQIGDYLIGDGEIGLCKKIHEAAWKMVWVPHALVWHCQNVSQHATLSDLQRRFANNGVANAYGDYKRQPNGVCFLLPREIETSCRFVIYKLWALKHQMLRDPDAYRLCALRGAYHRAQMIYYLRLIWDLRFRNLVLREDWIGA